MNKLLNINDVIELTSLSRSTILRNIENNKLKCFQVVEGRRELKFYKDDVLDFMKSREKLERK